VAGHVAEIDALALDRLQGLGMGCAANSQGERGGGENSTNGHDKSPVTRLRENPRFHRCTQVGVQRTINPIDWINDGYRPC
jgi:hypothetical protein